jgi:cold shock CspA family protein
MSLRRRSSGFSGVLACGHGYRLQGLSESRAEIETEQREVLKLLRQQPVVPGGDLGQPVIGDHEGAGLRWGQVTQLYFHRNSLTEGDFDKLRVGDRVHFTQVDGDTGGPSPTNCGRPENQADNPARKIEALLGLTMPQSILARADEVIE